VPHLHRTGKSVVFCWVPGHTNLPGNEDADAATKVVALYGPLTSDQALGSDVLAFLSHAVLSL
jgi:hypothetical protein